MGNVFDLTIWRRTGAVDGRVELDHVLVGDIASSEKTSSLVALALRKASKGFSSFAYMSLSDGLQYGDRAMLLPAGAE